ncbi:hypothetical protein P43SY_008931 [Pythium insidiosum]|uniref:Prefoldin subunit n=1 Tax=Pythium insidiosum TaxID=114742 RepID=A0AAD5LPE7_PYTIN|nr:hypothetical protein P43SY_008931 [Pythium insidiosum]
MPEPVPVPVLTQAVAPVTVEAAPQVTQQPVEAAQAAADSEDPPVADLDPKKRLALVEKEVTDLPQDVVTYQSIGKMFLRTTPQENAATLKTDVTRIDDQVSSLEARKQYLTRQKTSLDENITELLAQCTAAAN